MARRWTCRKCKTVNPRVKQRCGCGRKRPAPRKPKHMACLDEHSYEWFVKEFGERCGICGKGPSGKRRLDRDHEHRDDGKPRGLLCSRCNRRLGDLDVKWLWRAIDYLNRAARRTASG